MNMNKLHCDVLLVCRPSNTSPLPMNGFPIRQRSSSKKRKESVENTPRAIDVIGNGSQTTISGHIDLLQHLPLHNEMHRRLLKTYRREPGNYEGQYNDEVQNRAVIKDLGNGYLSMHLYHDITQVELSEFLVSKGWITLSVSHDGKNTYDKWTNMIKKKSKLAAARQPSVLRQAERYY